MANSGKGSKKYLGESGNNLTKIHHGCWHMKKPEQLLTRCALVARVTYCLTRQNSKKQVRAYKVASDLRFFGRDEILASEILQEVITTNMQVKRGVYLSAVQQKEVILPPSTAKSSYKPNRTTAQLLI